MINPTNLALIRSWLISDERQALRTLNDYSSHLGDELMGYIARMGGILQYLEYAQIQRFLDGRDSSQPLHVLDLGCGDGWEAFSLAFLLFPAQVFGIGYTKEGPQDWEKNSYTSGALTRTLPDLLERLKRISAQIQDDRLYNTLGKLYSAMAVILPSHLALMRLDIENPAWPKSSSYFDFVFSRFAFYHTTDRFRALQNIKRKMAPNSVYLLHEPNVKIDGNPDLTDTWFDQVAIRQVGFQRFEIIETESTMPVIVLWNSD